MNDPRRSAFLYKAALKCSPTDYLILKNIDAAKDAPHLAELVGLRTKSLGKLLDDLELRGLVETRPCEDGDGTREFLAVNYEGLG